MTVRFALPGVTDRDGFGVNTARIHVAAAVIMHDGKVLLARRTSGPLAGKWEFPGGKVEAGESPEQCLVREIEEELGIRISVASFLGRSDYDYPDVRIRLDGYLCELLEGSPDLRQVVWAEPGRLLNCELAPADVPLAEKVAELPDRDGPPSDP